MTQIVNREDWLGQAAKVIAELILTDHEMPPVRISVGWPSKGARSSVRGECWSQGSVADGVSQIFIRPSLGEDDTQLVLAILTHELIHAVDDCDSGHGGQFMRIAKSIGFLPKFESADNRSDELSALLDEVAEIVGLFPNPEIERSVAASRSQVSRQLKVQCPECGCIARMSRKAIDEVGLPTCACGIGFEEA